MDQNVLYRGQRLTLTRFWATGEPCLWITDPEQIPQQAKDYVAFLEKEIGVPIVMYSTGPRREEIIRR